MLDTLRRVALAVRDRRACARDPEGFARSIGVDLRGRVRFYGIDRGMFGSEPWLVSLGDNVYITAGVQFVTHDGGTLILRRDDPDLEWTAPITVGDDVYIGVRSIILPGVTIGDRCIIGAGSVVAKDVPANSVAAGVPARVIRSTDEYLEAMRAKSLRCGHLPAAEKAAVIRQHYGVTTRVRTGPGVF
ncbi:DapH/DapD/GlmU-related protein [Micromonospora purpureochromogenes]|uniref:Acetyltransferase-like isoleucine patch superfamily enzyme n=1 Tax=Micromonospora purpureochromogenes TaxID=47872 RepID=A0ABX2RPF9_9ACTN|nr:DapH/DapD/GlmU-related protein [Micromonospora purpureochromogenes]NYF58221.1 acetyltransferase-like isoleucine patch superfamily enzyme [Micromonospora purpureochromogenes]